MRYRIIFLFAVSTAFPVFCKAITPNAMAPLVVGDIYRPNDTSQDMHWREFERALEVAKKMGVYAISTDVWWGVAEPTRGSYQWDYYDKIAKTILGKGLKWVPILSFHQCGGNVGDTCSIPLPKWVWTHYRGKPGIPDENALKYKSEQGNISQETVSVWGTKTVLGDYERFFREFQNHFKKKAKGIAEINISLGPAGELRYPSYNSHDKEAAYPTRGSLQSYSNLAVESWRSFVQEKYRTLDAVNAAWGFSLGAWNEVYPPSGLGPSDGSGDFFKKRKHFSPYGKDFFDWYQDSLLEHGRLVLSKAFEVFDAPGADFAGIDLGAKIAGVHWRAKSDRLAELASGLLRTSDVGWSEDALGHGYSKVIALFKTAGAKRTARLQLHYTCLEKGNGEDGEFAQSEAKSMVFWIGAEAARQKVSLKGENALSGPLASDGAWDNMLDVLQWSSYSGLTILRLGDIADESSLAHRRYKDLISKFEVP